MISSPVYKITRILHLKNKSIQCKKIIFQFSQRLVSNHKLTPKHEERYKNRKEEVRDQIFSLEEISN